MFKGNFMIKAKHDNTNLTTTAEFARHGTSDSTVNIGTVKDDERSVAAKFHWDPFDRASSLPQKYLPNATASFIMQLMTTKQFHMSRTSKV